MLPVDENIAILTELELEYFMFIDKVDLLLEVNERLRLIELPVKHLFDPLFLSIFVTLYVDYRFSLTIALSSDQFEEIFPMN